jgi:hypothetical protein
MEPWEQQEIDNAKRVIDLIGVLHRLANPGTADWEADRAIWIAVKRELEASNRNYSDILLAKSQLEVAAERKAK